MNVFAGQRNKLIAQCRPKATGYDATARCQHDPKCLSPWGCSFYERAKEVVG
jgi:hypothetical protein